jgi:hypothetical protein
MALHTDPPERPADGPDPAAWWLDHTPPAPAGAGSAPTPAPQRPRPRALVVALLLLLAVAGVVGAAWPFLARGKAQPERVAVVEPPAPEAPA